VYPARLITLMISDIPGDDPSLIASGPSVADTSTAKATLEIIDRRNIDLPNHLRAAVKTSLDGPRKGASVLETARSVIIAAPARSLNEAAKNSGEVEVRILGDALEGEARDLAAEHANMALSIQGTMSPGDTPILLLSGGECTVTKRGDGIGGPNAEYVLAAAIALNGAKGIHVLACDTDGVDGAAEVAGAYAGPEMLAKADQTDTSAKAALETNDAHRFFKKLDDQIITGPTMTNVNDFRAILILPN